MYIFTYYLNRIMEETWSNNKLNAMPVVATRSIERLQEDIAAFNIYLDESEINWLLGEE